MDHEPAPRATVGEPGANPFCRGLADRHAAKCCTTPKKKLVRLLGTSLALSACGFGPLSLVGACLAWLSRQRLRNLPRPQRGLRWANAALAAGILNTSLWLGTWMWLSLEDSPVGTSPSAFTSGLLAGHSASQPSFFDYPDLETLQSTDIDGTGPEVSFRSAPGGLIIADVSPSVPSLQMTLAHQARLAARTGRAAIAWLVVPQCEPCDAMTVSLASPRMQAALRDTVLLRLDARQFAAELGDLGIPTARLPGLSRLNESGEPTDYLHSGEWDDERPELMAPILGRFARGRRSQRRFPWRGGQRVDETSI